MKTPVSTVDRSAPAHTGTERRPTVDQIMETLFLIEEQQKVHSPIPNALITILQLSYSFLDDLDEEHLRRFLEMQQRVVAVQKSLESNNSKLRETEDRLTEVVFAVSRCSPDIGLVTGGIQHAGSGSEVHTSGGRVKGVCAGLKRSPLILHAQAKDQVIASLKKQLERYEVPRGRRRRQYVEARSACCARHFMHRTVHGVLPRGPSRHGQSRSTDSHNGARRAGMESMADGIASNDSPADDGKQAWFAGARKRLKAHRSSTVILGPADLNFNLDFDLR